MKIIKFLNVFLISSFNFLLWAADPAVDFTKMKQTLLVTLKTMEKKDADIKECLTLKVIPKNKQADCDAVIRQITQEADYRRSSTKNSLDCLNKSQSVETYQSCLKTAYLAGRSNSSSVSLQKTPQSSGYGPSGLRLKTSPPVSAPIAAPASKKVPQKKQDLHK